MHVVQQCSGPELPLKVVSLGYPVTIDPNGEGFDSILPAIASYEPENQRTMYGPMPDGKFTFGPVPDDETALLIRFS